MPRFASAQTCESLIRKSSTSATRTATAGFSRAQHLLTSRTPTWTGSRHSCRGDRQTMARPERRPGLAGRVVATAAG